VDDVVVMRVLKRRGDLLGIRHGCLERETGAARVMLQEGPTRSVVHNEKRGPVLLHSKVMHAHDVGMLQAGERLRFSEELIYLLVFERGVQDLERCPAFQEEMLAEVDLGEAPSPEQAQEAVVAKLLADALWHGCHP
jgi:hypothetical protein